MITQRLNRIAPRLGAAHVKTYEILAPLRTHFRTATCEEADCVRYLTGFEALIDEATELGQAQAHFIRHDTSRPAPAERRDEAGLTHFLYPPGTPCFAGGHRVRVDRPEIYVVRDGDWRGNPRGTAPRRHDTPEHWVEDFAEHQGRLADKFNEG